MARDHPVKPGKDWFLKFSLITARRRRKITTHVGSPEQFSWMGNPNPSISTGMMIWKFSNEQRTTSHRNTSPPQLIPNSTRKSRNRDHPTPQGRSMGNQLSGSPIQWNHPLDRIRYDLRSIPGGENIHLKVIPFNHGAWFSSHFTWYRSHSTMFCSPPLTIPHRIM